MLDEPVRAAAPLNGTTVLVGAETGPEDEAPATPGTGAAGAGPDGGLVAAAWAGAGVPATRPTLAEAPVLKATCGKVTCVWSSWVVVQPEGMPEVWTWTWPSEIWLAVATGQGTVTVVEMEMVVGGSWGAGTGVPAAGAGAAVVTAAAGGAAAAAGDVGAGEPAGAGALASGGGGAGACAAGVGTRVMVVGTAVMMAGLAGTCCAQIPA